MNVTVLVPGYNKHKLEEAARLLTAAELVAEEGEVKLWLLGEEAPEREALRLDCGEILFQKVPPGADPAAVAQGIQPLWEEAAPGAVLFPASLAGSQLADQLARRAGWPCMLGVCGFERTDSGLLAERSVYSMNLQGLFRLPEKGFVLSVETGSFPEKPLLAQARAKVRTGTAAIEQSSWYRDVEQEFTQEQDSIRNAKIVIAAGRGMGKDAIPDLEALAEKLGGRLGGTRPVILDGWLSLDRMIGASGAMIHPEVCLVFGASGAAPFVVGVEKSGLLVGINTDPDALLFRACDLGTTLDGHALVKALTERLDIE